MPVVDACAGQGNLGRKHDQVGAEDDVQAARSAAELKEPVELQLFRNDEDVDSTGKYTLEPGQQLDLSPVF